MGRENPVIAQPSNVTSISEPPEPLKTTTSTKSTAFRQFTPVTEFVFTQSFHSITSGRKFALTISLLERRWLQIARSASGGQPVRRDRSGSVVTLCD